jgi:hypothetical protein
MEVVGYRSNRLESLKREHYFREEHGAMRGHINTNVGAERKNNRLLFCWALRKTVQLNTATLHMMTLLTFLLGVISFAVATSLSLMNKI